MKSLVISDIVENNLCIGCCVCAALCLKQTLEIESVWSVLSSRSEIVIWGVTLSIFI